MNPIKVENFISQIYLLGPANTDDDALLQVKVVFTVESELTNSGLFGQASAFKETHRSF